jgi:hypothetical protein
MKNVVAAAKTSMTIASAIIISRMENPEFRRLITASQ